MSKRQWYELRVREEVAPETWVKKSKFYFVRGPRAAVDIYKKRRRAPFSVMWCTKNGHHSPERFARQVQRLERELVVEARGHARSGLRVVTDFLGLGNDLLRDISGKSTKPKRGYHGKSRKETTT